MRLLFVCTGNLCRSPVAERLAAAWARQSLGPAAAGIDTWSAGLEAPIGHEMDPLSAGALTRLGGDPAGFLSRRWTPRMSDDADLVITMTRRQRRAVLEGSPRALRRTYTLLEAADLLRKAHHAELEAIALPYRARHLAQRLDAGRARRKASADDDILDPIGRPAKVHEAVASQIADALRPLAVVLFVASPIDRGSHSSDETIANARREERGTTCPSKGHSPR